LYLQWIKVHAVNHGWIFVAANVNNAVVVLLKRVDYVQIEKSFRLKRVAYSACISRYQVKVGLKLATWNYIYSVQDLSFSNYMFFWEPSQVGHHWFAKYGIFYHGRHRNAQGLLDDHKVVVSDGKSVHVGRVQTPSGGHAACVSGFLKHFASYAWIWNTKNIYFSTNDLILQPPGKWF
jgi:hypothetical protein